MCLSARSNDRRCRVASERRQESGAERVEANRLWRIRENEQHRAAVCEWLTANGIDIMRVPQDARASIADGKLTIPLWVLDENGYMRVDPNEPNTLMRETVTVPVKVPPSPVVEVWLTPKCPACGR